MLSDEGQRNFFNQIHTLWIRPELERRWGTDGPPKDFRIRRALIRLPVGRSPIVEFNDEVHWTAEVEMAPGHELAEGAPVFLHQIAGVKAVQPPEVDGQRVAFVFLYHQGGAEYGAVFDFSPNSDDPHPPETPRDWSLGEAVADYLRQTLVERAVSVPDRALDQLRQVGLWPAPALLPYPMSAIVKSVDEGDAAAARAMLIRHCSADFLRRLVDGWWQAPEYAVRRALFEQALAAHAEGRYGLAIYALLPHVEGVVTDWLYGRLPEADVPWRQESKTKKFAEAVGAGRRTAADKRVADAAMEFILQGPVLQTFKRWSDSIDAVFPARHVLGAREV